MENNKKKRITGIVVSDKLDKTVIVSAKIIKPHKKYHKVVSSDKKYMAHDRENEHKIGDVVAIEESIPISKRKKWKVVEIISK